MVKDEYSDEARRKWVEAAREPDFTFLFTADTVRRTHQNNSEGYHLLLDEEKKSIELRSMMIKGIAEVL